MQTESGRVEGGVEEDVVAARKRATTRKGGLCRSSRKRRSRKRAAARKGGLRRSSRTVVRVVLHWSVVVVVRAGVRAFEEGQLQNHRAIMVAHVRHMLDDKQPQAFYVHIHYYMPQDVYAHHEIWTIVVPLVNFEIIKCHPTNQVRQQFGYPQPLLGPRKNLDSITMSS
ncbi:hypothetical protein HN51_012553 [Arachis hypogaea]